MRGKKVWQAVISMQEIETGNFSPPRLVLIPVDTTQARRSCSLATSISMRLQGLPPHRSVRRSFRTYLRVTTFQQRLARFWIPDERSIGSLRGDRFARANPRSVASCPLPTTTLFR